MTNSVGSADGRADARADGRADARADGRADARADGRADARADGRADAQADGTAVGGEGPDGVGERVPEEGKPEWGLVLVPFALASLTLRFGGVWDWWALLWVPLYVAALGIAAVSWQMLVRCRWRMPVKEWVLFGLTHFSALSSLATLVGLRPV